MVLTGRHSFVNGRRAGLLESDLTIAGVNEVPTDGNDIKIGSGTWVASGAIITGGCSVGKDCIVAAGSVVTKEFGDGLFIAGVPARVIRDVCH